MHTYHSLQMLKVLFLLPWLTFQHEEKHGVFDTCKQLVVVVSPRDNSVNAQLYKFEKKGKVWQQVGKRHAVNLGKKGLAWGRGVNIAKPGLQKKEGDQRSPAGIFRFGTAFGYAQAETLPLKLPYIPITETQLCIEDSESPYYNQLVDATQVKQGCKALESMLRTDQQYKWGIFIKQNMPPKPECGSCIFFHLWRKQGSGTLGCTAMSEDNLLALMRWLDPKKEPLLLQMTEHFYQDYQKEFSLPVLSFH
jgi:L,D-peptidoglycan transpeptidase YkuD (ErfK/YbiS/YcfS/YnhG family)